MSTTVSIKEAMDLMNEYSHSDFKYEVSLRLNGKYEKFMFFTNAHEEEVKYFIGSEMILKTFEHWTGINSQMSLFYVCKGFIAGLIACSNVRLSY